MSKKLFLSIVIFFVSAFFTSHQLYCQNANEQKLRLAESYEKSGDMTSAARIYAELFKANPRNDACFQGLVRSYKTLNQYSELISVIEKKLETSNNAEILSIYGEILWRTGKTNDANQAWKKAIELNSDNPESYAFVAKAQNSLQLFDKVVATLEEARREIGQPHIFADDLSQLYVQTGNYSKGCAEILTVFEQNGNFSQAQGRLQALMNKPESTIFIQKQIEDKVKETDSQLYYRLYGWFLRIVKKLDLALNIYKKIDEMSNAGGREIYTFGDLSRRDRQWDIALKAYSLIIEKGKKHPYVQNALFGYARTLEARFREDADLPAGFLDTIIIRYRYIIKEFPNTATADDSRFRIAQIYFDHMNRPDDAEKELSELVKSRNNSTIIAMSMNLLGDVYIMQEKFDESAKVLGNLIKTYSKNAPDEVSKSKYRLAQIEFFTGNVDSARSYFSQLTATPSSPVANDAMQKVLLIDQNKNLNKALADYAEAEIRLLQHRSDDAIKALKNSVKLGEGSDICEAAVIKLSRLYNENKLYDSTIAIVNFLLEKMPESIYGDEAMLLKADAQTALKQNDNALKTYNDILIKFSRSIFLQEVREKIRKLRMYHKS